MIKIIMAIVLSTLLLSSTVGCSSVQKIEAQTVAVEKTPLRLPDPDPVKLERIDWKLVTEGTAKEVFGELEKAGIDPVIFGLTDNDYQNIAINLERLRGYILQLRETLKQYRMYYEPPEEAKDGKPPS